LSDTYKVGFLRKHLGTAFLLGAGIGIIALLPSDNACASSAARISPRLRSTIDTLQSAGQTKVWVYFTDKDVSQKSLADALASFAPKAKQRRIDIPPDSLDLPVSDEYENAIVRLGASRVRASRWLNAVSAYMNADQIYTAADLPFVRSLVPVARLSHGHPAPVPGSSQQYEVPPSFYGPSFTQLHMMRVDSLHSAGLTGAGVLIAFLDTGYGLAHRALESLHIIATWDFINDKESVDDEIVEGQTIHGTCTLSAAAGYVPDTLIGPAFGADVLLAKTEMYSAEEPIEEDYWVFGAEWADSAGADIISASLGYLDWYDYADMDGNTAVTTRAADIAASRGILVVTSAGNEGDKSWGKIIAPADADSVLAVGAVTTANLITNFSSRGPSFDGRIKPEVVALGQSVYCAEHNGGYTRVNGTSLSAPLVGGGAALILEAYPELRGQPLAVRGRILKSSDRYNRPENTYGYGLPDFVIAAGYGLRIISYPPLHLAEGSDTIITIEAIGPPGEQIIFSLIAPSTGVLLDDHGDGTAEARIEPPPIAGDLVISARAGEYFDTLTVDISVETAPEPITCGPNPFRDHLDITARRDFSGDVAIDIYSLSGERVFSTLLTGFALDETFSWNARNADQRNLASGVYILRLSADGIEKRYKLFKL
jgi:serine protease AprX